MRLLLAAALLVLGLMPAAALEVRPYDAGAFAAAQAAGKPVLIDVHAGWCPTCRAQASAIDALTDDPRFRTLVVFRVDYDNQREIMRSFGARARSTLIAFSGTTETGRLVGETDPMAIDALLTSALR